MKAKKSELKFKPVVITLETQEELDALVTILNNSAKIHESCNSQTYQRCEPFSASLWEELVRLGGQHIENGGTK